MAGKIATFENVGIGDMIGRKIFIFCFDTRVIKYKLTHHIYTINRANRQDVMGARYFNEQKFYLIKQHPREPKIVRARHERFMRSDYAYQSNEKKYI